MFSFCRSHVKYIACVCPCLLRSMLVHGVWSCGIFSPESVDYYVSGPFPFRSGRPPYKYMSMHLLILYFHSLSLQKCAFQSDNSSPTSVDLTQTTLPRRGWDTCGRESHCGDRESHCSVDRAMGSGVVVAVRGECTEPYEYKFDDSHSAAPPSIRESQGAFPPSSGYDTIAVHVPTPTPSLPTPMITATDRGALPPITTTSCPTSLLNGKGRDFKNSDTGHKGESAHIVSNDCCRQLDGFQLGERLKQPHECALLFETRPMLVAGTQKTKCVGDLQHYLGECVDSGGSSSGQGSSGGSSSSGKKHQNNRSGSSSSQQSGSGSSQRGGTGMGGGGRRSHSGSSDSSDDNGDDDHNKRPRRQPSKEPKPKGDLNEDDDDDEETDSADEGEDDTTPRSMTVDVSPQSVQNDNGGPLSSHGGSKEQGEGGGGVGGRNIPSLRALPFLSGGANNRFSSGGSGGTVESITLKEGIAGSGRIGTTTLVAGPQINSPVNMAVGYGAPVLVASEGDGMIAPASTSVPGSELGTPTLDSPSPPPLGGRDTPGTPPAVSPEIAPTAQV